MPAYHVEDLPPPPPDRTGFPWTIGTPILTDAALPTISVITPSYNQGEFLEETIRSVLLQGYPHLEYLVMDGGSTDDSRAILQKYDAFITAWVSEPDGGQTNAINKGFRRSTGAVMGWLNSDDVLLPGALHAIGHAYQQHPDWQITAGFRRLIDAKSHIMHNWIRGIPQKRYLQHRNILGQETVYWRRSVWETLGDLDESLRFCMDVDYWQRMLQHDYQIHLLPHYIGGFRQHGDSKTSTLTTVYQQELDQILQRYGIASSEADALATLGYWWDVRYNLIKDLCHQPLFDDPQRALWLLRWIQAPVVSLPLLLAYVGYRRLVDGSMIAL